MSRKAKPIEIDGTVFRTDYMSMSQAALKEKYNITSAKLMQLVKMFVPAHQRYGSRMRYGQMATVETGALREAV